MKRWIRRIVLCLLLGALTTVGVAWVCAGAVKETSTRPSRMVQAREGDSVLIRTQQLDEWSSTVSIAIRMQGYADHEVVGLDDAYELLPWWTGLREESAEFAEGSISTEIRWVAAYGWPLDALFYRVQADVITTAPPNRTSPYLFHVTGGIEHHQSSLPYAFHRAFPATPLFPGFLINTLFYGVVWFMLFFGPGTVRRTVRRRRGRCPLCAYNLQGALDAGCPECGWNREAETMLE